MNWNRIAFAVVAVALTTAPAMAGWKVATTGQPVTVAKSTLSVRPLADWNMASARPSKKGEMWTIDGATLNELSFFAGVAPGEALVKERDKKNKPLPKVTSGMLLTDIPPLLEQTMRIALGTSLFEVETMEPAKLAGHDAITFRYRYVVEADNLERRGEARAALVNGKLYVINFSAPKIHYFDRDIDAVRRLMDSATL